MAVEPLVTFLANGRFYVDKRGWPHHGADRAPGEDEAATNAVLAIGEAAVIGANSVVISDVPPYCLAVGNPAEVYFRNYGRPSKKAASS